MDYRDFEEGALYGDLTVGFLAKAPYKTWWLKIYHSEGKEPKELIEALSMIGWVESDRPGPAPIKGRIEREFAKKGTALFGSWTPAEEKHNMSVVRNVLRQFKIAGVPKKKLTLADLM